MVGILLKEGRRGRIVLDSGWLDWIKEADRERCEYRMMRVSDDESGDSNPVGFDASS